MEEENAWAALQNNMLGTWNAATAAAEAGAERFVLISTDKAVNPTNVMGASKRAAEMVLSQLATRGHATTFSAVRFGNVLGSSGSVIPKFKEQIAKRRAGHGDAPGDHALLHDRSPRRRGWCCRPRRSPRPAQVYVLDMGEPVKIVDLARDLIRLSGHREKEIAIVFSGLRPGEKLYEELLTDADQTLPSQHPRLRIARAAGADERRMAAPDCSAGWPPRASGDRRRSASRSWRSTCPSTARRTAPRPSRRSAPKHQPASAS